MRPTQTLLVNFGRELLVIFLSHLSNARKAYNFEGDLVPNTYFKVKKEN
jgi:hypothetical protein